MFCLLQGLRPLTRAYPCLSSIAPERGLKFRRLRLPAKLHLAQHFLGHICLRPRTAWIQVNEIRLLRTKFPRWSDREKAALNQSRLLKLYYLPDFFFFLPLPADLSFFLPLPAFLSAFLSALFTLAAFTSAASPVTIVLSGRRMKPIPR